MKKWFLPARQKVFCAFCSLPFKVYRKKNVGWFEVTLSIVLAAVSNFLYQGDFHYSLLIAAGLMLMSLELFVRMRWKNSVVCTHCAFDPLLYKKNPELAATKVNEFMKFRKTSTKHLLRPTPQIPTRQKAEKTLHKKSLSLQV